MDFSESWKNLHPAAPCGPRGNAADLSAPPPFPKQSGSSKTRASTVSLMSSIWLWKDYKSYKPWLSATYCSLPCLHATISIPSVHPLAWCVDHCKTRLTGWTNKLLSLSSTFSCSHALAAPALNHSTSRAGGCCSADPSCAQIYGLPQLYVGCT